MALVRWHGGGSRDPVVGGCQSLLVDFKALTHFLPIVSGIGKEFLQPLNTLALGGWTLGVHKAIVALVVWQGLVFGVEFDGSGSILVERRALVAVNGGAKDVSSRYLGKNLTVFVCAARFLGLRDRLTDQVAVV
mgnify:CR=1 FL=1